MAEGNGIFFSQQAVHLVGCKDIVFPLNALAVSILSAEKSAMGCFQFPQHIFHRASDHSFIELPMAVLKGLGIGKDQQSIVVQHFFKVRNQPLSICGIAGKPAAHMVKKAAAIHGFQRDFCHFHCRTIFGAVGISHEKYKVVGRGKLGRSSKATPSGIKRLGKLSGSPIDNGLFGGAGSGLLCLSKIVGQFLTGRQ